MTSTIGHICVTDVSRVALYLTLTHPACRLHFQQNLPVYKLEWSINFSSFLRNVLFFHTDVFVEVSLMS